MKTKELFLTDNSIAIDLIRRCKYPFEVLPYIESYINFLGSTLDDSYEQIQEGIWIAKDAVIDDTASITGPCIIDHNAELRHNAFIRGNAIIGKNCVFGNSCEIKNAILFDGAKVPHFSYVGDSILGYNAHLGAGVITSNLKSDKSPVVIKEEEPLNTGMNKVGAFIGDYVEVGCNTVLNPGTIVGPNTSIYPLTNVRGIIPANMIVKNNEMIRRRKN